MSKLLLVMRSKEKREEFITEAEQLLNIELKKIKYDNMKTNWINYNLNILKINKFNYIETINNLFTMGICTKTLEDIIKGIDVTDLLESILEKIKIGNNKVISDKDIDCNIRYKCSLENVELSKILNLIASIKDGKNMNLSILNNFIKNDSKYINFDWLELDKNRLCIKDNKIILINIIDEYLYNLNSIYILLGDYRTDPILNKYYKIIINNIKQLTEDYFIDFDINYEIEHHIDSIFVYTKTKYDNEFSNYILNNFVIEYNYNPYIINPTQYISFKPYDKQKNNILKNIIEVLLPEFNHRLYDLMNSKLIDKKVTLIYNKIRNTSTPVNDITSNIKMLKEYEVKTTSDIIDIKGLTDKNNLLRDFLNINKYMPELNYDFTQLYPKILYSNVSENDIVTDLLELKFNKIRITLIGTIWESHDTYDTCVKILDLIKDIRDGNTTDLSIINKFIISYPMVFEKLELDTHKLVVKNKNIILVDKNQTLTEEPTTSTNESSDDSSVSELKVEPIKGKLIVFEGLDYSFKETNSKALYEYIKKNITSRVELYHFPQYDSQSSYFTKEYLKGNYKKDSNPFGVATMYALDRYDWCVKNDIKNKLDNGYYIICDRYVESNVIFQCTDSLYFSQDTGRMELNHKLANKIYDLEYKTFKLPKPDITLYMDMPVSVSSVLIKDRAKKNGEEVDIIEDDNEFMKRAEIVFDGIKEPTTTIVLAGTHKRILDKYSIFRIILRILENKNII